MTAALLSIAIRPALTGLAESFGGAGVLAGGAMAGMAGETLSRLMLEHGKRAGGAAGDAAADEFGSQFKAGFEGGKVLKEVAVESGDAFRGVGGKLASNVLDEFNRVVSGQKMDLNDIIKPFEVLENAITGPVMATVGRIPILGRALRDLKGDFDTITAGSADFMQTMIDVGDSYIEATRKIAGATVDSSQLEGLMSTVREVAGSGAIVHFEDVANNIGRLNTNIANLNPQQLRELVTTFAEAEELVGRFDATKFSGVINAWGVDADHANEMLTQLVNTSRITGLGMDQMIAEMQQVGPSMRAFGYDAGQTAQFFAEMQKAGEPAQRAVFMWTKAFASATKSGEDPKTWLANQLTGIKQLMERGDENMAAKLFEKAFGQRAAPLLLEDIKKGLLDLPELMKPLEGINEPIEKGVEETKSLGDAFEVIGQQIRAALEPVGMYLAKGLVEGSTKISEWLEQNQDKIVHWATEVAVWIERGVQDVLRLVADGLGAISGFLNPVKELMVGFIQFFMSQVDLAIHALAALPIIGHLFTGARQSLDDLRNGLLQFDKIDFSHGAEALSHTINDLATNKMSGLIDKTREVGSAFEANSKISEAFEENIGGKMKLAVEQMHDAHGALVGGTAESPFNLHLLGSPEQQQDVINKLRQMGIDIQASTAGVISSITFANDKAHDEWTKWYAEQSKKPPIDTKLNPQDASGHDVKTSGDLVQPGTVDVTVLPKGVVMAGGVPTPSYMAPQGGGLPQAPLAPGVGGAVPQAPLAPGGGAAPSGPAPTAAGGPGSADLASVLASRGVSPSLARLIQGFAVAEGPGAGGVPSLGFVSSEIGSYDLPGHVDRLLKQFQDRASVSGPFPEGGTDEQQGQWIARVVGQEGKVDYHGDQQPSLEQYVRSVVQNMPARGSAPAAPAAPLPAAPGPAPSTGPSAIFSLAPPAAPAAPAPAPVPAATVPAPSTTTNPKAKTGMTELLTGPDGQMHWYNDRGTEVYGPADARHGQPVTTSPATIATPPAPTPPGPALPTAPAPGPTLPTAQAPAAGTFSVPGFAGTLPVAGAPPATAAAPATGQPHIPAPTHVWADHSGWGYFRSPTDGQVYWVPSGVDRPNLSAGAPPAPEGYEWVDTDSTEQGQTVKVLTKKGGAKAGALPSVQSPPSWYAGQTAPGRTSPTQAAPSGPDSTHSQYKDWYPKQSATDADQLPPDVAAFARDKGMLDANGNLRPGLKLPDPYGGVPKSVKPPVHYGPDISKLPGMPGGPETPIKPSGPSSWFDRSGPPSTRTNEPWWTGGGTGHLNLPKLGDWFTHHWHFQHGGGVGSGAIGFDQGGAVGSREWLTDQLKAGGLSDDEARGVIAMNSVEGGFNDPLSTLGFQQGQIGHGGPQAAVHTFLSEQWNDPGRRWWGSIPGVSKSGKVTNWNAYMTWIREKIVGQVGANPDMFGNVQPPAGEYQGRLMSALGRQGGGDVPWMPGTRWGQDGIHAIVAPGEHIWSEPEVAAAGGHGAMSRARAAALEGKFIGHQPGGPAGQPGPPGQQVGALNTEGAQVDTIAVGYAVEQAFGITNQGFYRAPDNYNEHSSGEAVDVMVGAVDNPVGYQIKDFALANAAAFDVQYCIWANQLWYPGGRVDNYGSTGSVTDQHRDHVHIRTSGGGYPPGGGPGAAGSGGAPSSGETKNTPAPAAAQLLGQGTMTTPLSMPAAQPGVGQGLPYAGSVGQIGAGGPVASGYYNPFTAMPPGLSPREQQEWTSSYQSWQQSQLSSQQAVTTSGTELATAQRNLAEKYQVAQQKQGEYDKLRETANTPELQAAMAEQLKKAAGEAQAAHDEWVSASNAEVSAKDRNSDAVNREAIERGKPPPKPPSGGKGRGEFEPLSEQFGKGFIKGFMQELGLPDVFGKPFTEWGIWKLMMGGAGVGLGLMQNMGSAATGIFGQGGPLGGQAGENPAAAQSAGGFLGGLIPPLAPFARQANQQQPGGMPGAPPWMGGQVPANEQKPNWLSSLFGAPGPPTPPQATVGPAAMTSQTPANTPTAAATNYSPSLSVTVNQNPFVPSQPVDQHIADVANSTATTALVAPPSPVMPGQ